MDTDAAAASAAAGDGANNAAGAAAAAPAKKKVRKIDVPFNPLSQFGYSQKQLDDFFEKEGQMAAVDKLQVCVCGGGGGLLGRESSCHSGGLSLTQAVQTTRGTLLSQPACWFPT
jgi:hypothetical protein